MAAALLSHALATLVSGIALTAGPAPGHGTWPVTPEPPVLAGFSPPEQAWGSGHRGVDLGGRVGQGVRSTLPGTVSFAGRIAGRGVVVVAHGRFRTTYEPVAASVRVGDDLAAGERLGHLEWFGSHCLPTACLHWGLLEGEAYLDPLTLVGSAPRPVRLLPLDGRPPVRPSVPPEAGSPRCLPRATWRPAQALGWACW